MLDSQKQGQGSPGGLLPTGFPNIQQYGVPTVNDFIKPEDDKPVSRHVTVREIYQDMVGQGMHPKDAAKQAQAQTGHSVVTGQMIKRSPKFSKKSGKIVGIGQYGVSGKSKFGQYGG